MLHETDQWLQARVCAFAGTVPKTCPLGTLVSHHRNTSDICHDPEVTQTSAASSCSLFHATAIFPPKHSDSNIRQEAALLSDVTAALSNPTLSQSSDSRNRGLMDMMGGVLEVKKEDILRMVRFLAIL
jgi:hypothetical protein